jgi:hypothetical protein
MVKLTAEAPPRGPKSFATQSRVKRLCLGGRFMSPFDP